MVQTNININKEKLKNILSSKKFKLTLFLLIGFVAIMFLLNFFKKEEKPEDITITTQELPTPKIETSYEGIFQIRFQVDKDKLDLPPTLPVYKLIKDPLTEDKIEALAKNLGFTKEPFVGEDAIDGTTYLYYSNSGRLRVVPYKRIIDLKIYKSDSNSFSEIPNNEELKELALNFLQKNNIVNNPNSFDLYKIQPLSLGPGGHFVENVDPNQINIVFVKSVDNYPILSPTAETGIVTVSINSKMEVVSVYFDDLPGYKKGDNHPALSFDEIVNAARSKSTIQSIADGKIFLFKLDSADVQVVTINQIEIAYLQENDPEQLLLQPVFLLKGTVKLKSREESQTVTLYLPAFSSELQK